MYIEFKLPTGAGGMAAGYTKMTISKQLAKIAREHNIKIIDAVSMGYTHCVELSEHDLTLLALCWDSKNQWHKFTVHRDKTVKDLRDLLAQK